MMSTSSFSTFMKCLQSKMSLNVLGSVQKDSWSRRGRTRVAFMIFAAATMSHIYIFFFNLGISKEGLENNKKELWEV